MADLQQVAGGSAVDPSFAVVGVFCVVDVVVGPCPPLVVVFSVLAVVAFCNFLTMNYSRTKLLNVKKQKLT